MDRDRAHDIIIAIINTIILIILINIWIHIFVGFVQPSAQAAPLHHSLQVLAVWLCGHFFPPMALLKKASMETASAQSAWKLLSTRAVLRRAQPVRPVGIPKLTAAKSLPVHRTSSTAALMRGGLRRGSCYLGVPLPTSPCKQLGAAYSS